MLMVDVRKDFLHDLKWLGGFAVFIAVFVVGGYLALTAGRGLESEKFTTRFYIYIGMAIFGFLFIAGVKASRSLFKFKVDVPLHDPEMGLINIGVVRNPVSLISLLVIVLLLPLFFLGKYGGIFFSSVQQISVFSNLYADSAFPAVAENLLVGGVILGLLLMLIWRFKLNKDTQAVFWLLALLVIPLFLAWIWLNFHNLVYSSDEVAGVFTIVFGFVGIFVTVLTMSQIPWIVIHFLTNFVLSAKKAGMFSSDFFVLELFLIELVFIGIFVWSLYYNKKNKVKG